MAKKHLGINTLSLWKEAKEAIFNIEGIKQYLSLAIPGIINISEWWASEVAIFLSGRLVPYPDLALGSMTLYQSINTFCFMFPVSFAVSGSTRVGNLLGNNNSYKAKFSAYINIICTTLISFIIGCILYFLPHTFFPSLFISNDIQLIYETSKIIPLLALYVFADGIQASFNGIIKGCGKQVITMPIVVISYWFIGIPIAYYITFIKYNGIMCNNYEEHYFCGVIGLVTGMTIGTWIHMILLGFIVIGTTNWEYECIKAKSRQNLQVT